MLAKNLERFACCLALLFLFLYFFFKKVKTILIRVQRKYTKFHRHGLPCFLLHDMDPLQVWLGGMSLSSFRAVYIFNGEESADIDIDAGHGCWRQRHNPFLGRDAPPTFSQGWKAWHEVMFDEIDSRETENASKIMYITATATATATASSVLGPETLGVACVIERHFSTASAYLRAMAIELQLSEDDIFEGGFKRNEFSFNGFCNSVEEGFNHSDLHHEYAAFFMKIPPNTYAAATPYTCCDGHRIVSYLSAKVARATTTTTATTLDAASYNSDFFRPLVDLSLSCAHLTYDEIDLGWMYKQALCSAGVRHLSESVKRMQQGNKRGMKDTAKTNLKLEYRRLDLPFLFSIVDRIAVHDFFTSPGCVSRLGKAWRQWFCTPGINSFRTHAHCWRNRVRTIRVTLLTIVPHELQKTVPMDLLGSMCTSGDAATPRIGSALYATTLQACKAEHITKVRNAVSDIMAPRAVADCVIRMVCEFVGLDIFDTEDALIDDLSGWRNFDMGEFSGVGELFISNLKTIQKSNLLTARDPVLSRNVVEMARIFETGLDAADAASIIFCARLLEAGANPFAIFNGLELDPVGARAYDRVFCLLCFVLHRWARTSRAFFGISKERPSTFREALRGRAQLRDADPSYFVDLDKAYKSAVFEVTGENMSLGSVEDGLFQALEGMCVCVRDSHLHLHARKKRFKVL